METPIPIFELITTTGTIEIYANGVVEGCDNLVGIVNFIPHNLRPESLPLFSKPLQLAGSPISRFSIRKSEDGGPDSVAAT
jgi:hypothetical protein